VVQRGRHAHQERVAGAFLHIFDVEDKVVLKEEETDDRKEVDENCTKGGRNQDRATIASDRPYDVL